MSEPPSHHQSPATSQSRSPRNPAIRVMLMPKDTNAMGTIFGGIILSYIDQAGAIEAYRYCSQQLVTVSMHQVEFLAPVFVGDVVSFYADTVRIGRTSITVKVEVEAERRVRGEGTAQVTEAVVVYVHVDDQRHPIPVDRRPESLPTA